jgi:hypothetical protein
LDKTKRSTALTIKRFSHLISLCHTRYTKIPLIPLKSVFQFQCSAALCSPSLPLVTLFSTTKRRKKERKTNLLQRHELLVDNLVVLHRVVLLDDEDGCGGGEVGGRDDVTDWPELEALGPLVEALGEHGVAVAAAPHDEEAVVGLERAQHGHELGAVADVLLEVAHAGGAADVLTVELGEELVVDLLLLLGRRRLDVVGRRGGGVEEEVGPGLGARLRRGVLHDAQRGEAHAGVLGHERRQRERLAVVGAADEHDDHL